MKNLNFYVVICFCVFVVMACGSKSSNGDSTIVEPEYLSPETEECDYCNGTGVRRIPCPDCNGTGKKDSYYYEERTEHKACSSCFGSGELICAKCNGTDRQQCEQCFGRGVTQCFICKGEGLVTLPYVGRTVCTQCDGARVVKCIRCNGNGIVQCTSCSGGKVMCKDCWGNGYRSVPTTESGKRNTICDNCNGSKYFDVKCDECDGEGIITVN